jgi:2-methylcitrate dehydratase
MSTTWVQELAEWLASYPASALPAEVVRAGCRTTLDTVACAFGALEHDSAVAMRTTVRALGGAPQSSLIGGRLGGEFGFADEARTSVPNAILYNGTLIRALDCNDIFFRGGLGGHPSDNLAVALAVAEAEHASGLEYVRAVALGYELYWRLRQHLFAPAERYPWDHTSTSGLVGALMSGLLLGLEGDELANALAIGGSQTYTLAEVRRGEISKIKASANSITAHTGALAGYLARAGLSGPAELFEGRYGLLTALGLERSDSLLQALTAPIERWQLLDVSMKPFPAVGTSQSAIAATLELVRQQGLTADSVERVQVRFADLPIARQQIADPKRAKPRTRETADHSFHFLVAVSIEDGDVGPVQYEAERWLQPATVDLMRRVEFSVDPNLNAHTARGFPAVVTVETKSGARLTQEMLYVPGNPHNPLSAADLADKLRRLAGRNWPESVLEALPERLLGLGEEVDMAAVGPLLRGEQPGG